MAAGRQRVRRAASSALRGPAVLARAPRRA